LELSPAKEEAADSNRIEVENSFEELSPNQRKKINEEAKIYNLENPKDDEMRIDPNWINLFEMQNKKEFIRKRQIKKQIFKGAFKKKKKKKEKFKLPGMTVAVTLKK
jgi:hypothetical protein